MKFKAYFFEFIYTITHMRLKGMNGKMVLLATTPVFLLSFGAMFILFNVQQISSQLVGILGNTVPSITTSKDLMIEMRTMELCIWKVVNFKNRPAEAASFVFDFEDSLGRFNSNFERYLQLKMPENASKLRDMAFNKWHDYEGSFNSFKKMMADKKFDEVEKVYQESIKLKLNEIGDIFSNVELNNANIIEHEKESSEILSKKVSTKAIFITCGLAAILSFFGALFITNRITEKLLKITEDLNEQSELTRNQTLEMAEASKNLAEASSSAANAIDGTSAAISEIKETISKSNENAQMTVTVSHESVSSLVEGKKSIGQTRSSILEIQSAMEAMQEVVEENNTRMADILNVIKTIDSKTVMINDIVFQTKLLSFNASVEAARAGESGKGFAVVAEEIGKLAVSSGEASFEISKLLKESQTKVESIFLQTKADMSRVTTGVKNKITESEKSIELGLSLLDQLQVKSESVNLLVGEITQGLEEQMKGVDEVTRAINELNIISDQNRDDSQKIANSANLILEGSNTVTEISGLLKTIVSA